MEIQIRKINSSDREWVRDVFINNWGGDFIVSRGKIWKSDNLEGFIAQENGDKIGLVTVNIENNEMEIVTINSLPPGRGTGALLLKEVIKMAKEKNVKRIWLITTNDNLNALKFWQKNDFHLVRVYPGAIVESRKIKPQIPEIGEDGIPIRDEIEFEYLFS